ncbi:CCHC-type zinc finger nucleic acid binding protein-like [Halyomorpha halys]|uniref:CCHC-type zinc finger nucleic acid binding protein-like n=1 Tax=Halyomorpha halys TaxID=286706 RepID=UPI0006D4E3D1|nr:cellular nucleic acid-binding protein-like [Halyomorpha halys]
MAADQVEGRMQFLSGILKVQLAKELGKREGLPRERSFVECAQELMDLCAREEEARMEVEEPGWMRVEYNRPRNIQNFGRRRENRDSGRDRARYQENRGNQGKHRSNGRREDRKCHGCGQIGHLVAQCPRTRWFECGNEGHIAKQYRHSSDATSGGE